MDFGLAARERELLGGLSEAVERYGGQDRLFRSAVDGAFDRGLDDAIAHLLPIGAALGQRALIVEEVARLGLPALPGPRLLVGTDALEAPPPGPVAVMDRQRPGPVRVHNDVRLVVVLDGPVATVLEIDRLPAGSTVPVESSFGYPYGHLTAEAGKPLPPNRARLVRDRWHLCLATEIAGTARGALGEVAAHVRGRYPL